ncbi:MAG: hypothetical protein II438_03700 [Clostridiales bacterium]|nr:hypothetical protein [Clostridiales bacterium]
MSTLLLVDGNSIINRAYYAVIGRAPMTAPDGTPTGAVNGFFNSVLGVMKEYNPDYMCVLFDRREPTFRHKMSTEYKANRKGMPDDLAAQMPVVKNMLDLYGIKRMELAGYEADDLIGTLSKQGEEQGMDVYIFSGDHDDFKLISDKVSVIMPQSGKGMIKELRRQYPTSNIVPIDYDPGASEANQLNRIKLMISTAHIQHQKLLEKGEV